MRTRALLLTICLASAGLAAPAASAQTRPRTAAEIAKHAIPATVTILNIDSRGDGSARRCSRCASTRKRASVS